MRKQTLISAVMKIVESRPNLERLMDILYIEAKDGVSEKTCINNKKAYRLVYEVLDKYGCSFKPKQTQLYEDLKL